MPILHKAKKAPRKLLGANLPAWVSIYFTIYALAKGFTKTEILIKLFNDFIQSQKDSEEELVAQIVMRYQKAYNERPLKHDITIDDFRGQVAAELRFKEIPEGYIRIIVRRLQGHGANKE